MIILTRAQRIALKTVFDRQPLFNTPMDRAEIPAHEIVRRVARMTYRQFRRTVQPELCGPAVMVPWCGMWLGLETDGHVHS